MEREIKFRAWDGANMFAVDVMAISECEWSCPTHGKRGISLAYQPHIKVMQFTGLRDINGNEVYEGDILRQPIEEHNGRFTETVGYGIYEVKYRPDTYMIVGEGEGEWLCLEEFKGSTIIGNIYTHPQLLEHAH